MDARPRQPLRDLRELEPRQVHPLLRDLHQSSLDGLGRDYGQPLSLSSLRAEAGGVTPHERRVVPWIIAGTVAILIAIAAYSYLAR
jgi:hypothetical protein